MSDWRSTRLVIALGGNALLRRGESPDIEVQRSNVRIATHAIAQVARGAQIVVTHGNGPQVGLLALQAEAYRDARPYPLDVLGAQSEGMIGYLIEEELRNELPKHDIATLLTQVIVDPADPAFARPSKPIGPCYAEVDARRLVEARGWTIGADGEAWRRMVPSPEPRRIVEIGAIRLLVEAGVIVICAGGGGIPVVVDAAGALRGVEAVIDKDVAAALLASDLRADGLVMLTDVDAIYDGWGTPAARPIPVTTPSRLRAMSFAAGSMAPKVEAACRFVDGGGRFAAIGALADLEAILAGRAGTTVQASDSTCSQL
jgi:carbamate kinase